MKKIIITIIVLIPILVFGLSWFAGSALTAPVNQVVGNCPDDLACENVEFKSESGAKIKGWWLKGEQGKGAIVLMHGVRGNRLGELERIRFLRKAGYSVLAFDFQASGESIGKQITFGYLESNDAQASLEFARKTLPDEKIGVVGISMGGAAFLLQKEPPKVDALILEMVYPTMQSAVENRLNHWLFNGASVFSPILTWQFKSRIGVSLDELRPLDKVADLKMPKLFIVAGEDKHTTAEDSRKFFETASEPKEFWKVEGAEHGDLQKFAPPEYEAKVLGFFDKTLR